jgi:hypothetical protein
MLHGLEQLNYLNLHELFPNLPSTPFSILVIPSKDYYFSKYIPFSAIYLILEQNLNTRNYPRYELIM